MIRCILGIRTVKIIIGIRIRIIPCTVYIVIAITEFHNIPRMILSCIACHIVAWNIKLLQYILQCSRISRAHCPAIHKCTVSTLVHRRVGIIFHPANQCIVNNSFLLIIGITSVSLICDPFRCRLKLCFRRIQIVCCYIEHQRNISNTSLRRILIFVCCIHPEQFRVIIYHRCKCVFQIIRRNILHRRKMPVLCIGIGIDLSVKRSLCLIDNRIIWIQITVKSQAAPSLALTEFLCDLICPGLCNLCASCLDRNITTQPRNLPRYL